MIVLVALGCQGQGDALDGLSYWADAKPVLDANCVTCHQDGGIAPFSLTTYAEAAAVAVPLRNAVEARTMPPWQPADGCTDYAGDTSLSDADRDTLIAWVDADTIEGDPADAVEAPVAEEDTFEGDLALQLPEPYTPTLEPDDYRCQLVDWPVDHPTYVVGLEVEPDQRQMLHHAIVFAASAESAEAFRALDAADPGPGYTCFGGPTGVSNEDRPDLSDLSLAELMAAMEERSATGGQRWLGAWVPGSTNHGFPEGTGLPMSPGDVLIVQMHYNTSSSAPVADQSTVWVATSDTVSREAMILPLTDLGWVTGSELLGGAMTIPAGEGNVVHETVTAGDGLLPTSARATLGLPDDAPLIIHHVAHHMHQLGTTGLQEVRHADGTTQCLVDLPRWDFAWQGGYSLVEPVTVNPEDEIVLRCSWDNSAGNQPVIDGAVAEPQDVAWGEGTRDEMCLSTLYLTGP